MIILIRDRQIIHLWFQTFFLSNSDSNSPRGQRDHSYQELAGGVFILHSLSALVLTYFGLFFSTKSKSDSPLTLALSNSTFANFACHPPTSRLSRVIFHFGVCFCRHYLCSCIGSSLDKSFLSS